MAKKRRSSHVSGYERRDPPRIANAAVFAYPAIPRPASSPPALSFRISTLPRSGRLLTEVEDRRTFHPASVRPAASLRRPNHLLRAVVLHSLNARERSDRLAQPQRGVRARPGLGVRVSAPVRVGFRAPQSVLICIRRQRRREVLAAKGVLGVKRKHLRAPKRNYYSSVVCGRS